MKPENKVFIKSGLLSGLIYAILMAGFNYYDGEPFKIFKFLFLFFSLACLWVFWLVIIIKKPLKRKKPKMIRYPNNSKKENIKCNLNFEVYIEIDILK